MWTVLLVACDIPGGRGVDSPDWSASVDQTSDSTGVTRDSDSADDVDSAPPAESGIEDSGVSPPDTDGDGVADADDCAPADPQVFPGAPDRCWDDRDADCSGSSSGCAWAGGKSLAGASVVLTGEAAGDHAGEWVAAGDADGDGVSEVLVGASSAYGAGVVYVVEASSGSGSLSAATARLFGVEPLEQTGWAVLAADFDGDGVDDVAVSAPYAASDGVAHGPGAVRVVSGPVTGDIDLSAERTLAGSAADFVGTSIAAGDVDGDGIAELFAGAIGNASGGDASGAGFLVSAPLSVGTFASPVTTILGPAADESAGTASALTDMNGDGLADVLIAAGGPGGSEDAAAAAVFYAPSVGTVPWADADAVISPEDGEDHAGNPVLGTDVNGDGAADLLVGGIGDDAGRGAIFIRFGPLVSVSSLASPDARLVGAAVGDEAGCSVAVLDLDDDAALDVAVGAQHADAGSVDSGAVFIVLGPVAGVIDLAAADFILGGANAGGQGGESIAAGDIDADGRVDLLIGGWLDSTSASAAGSAWIMLAGAE